jgi:hypothetical protein
VTPPTHRLSPSLTHTHTHKLVMTVREVVIEIKQLKPDMHLVGAAPDALDTLDALQHR